MSHNHSSTHHHNTQTSNHKITLSAQEQARTSASQTKTFQLQRQDPKIESKSHLCITICGSRAGWRPPRETTPRMLTLVGWSGC